MQNSKNESFEYKTNILGSKPIDNNTLDKSVVVSLKYLSNFWNSLDFPFTDCEIELDLSWSKDCITSEISRRAAMASHLPNPARPAKETTNATLQINGTEIYVPIVTISIINNITF